MNKLKSEIDQKKVTLGIQIGQDGKLFGSVTTKQIVEAFETAHGILLDKKKVELDSEVNSIGIYTATVNLHKDIKAQFEVHIIEK
jgi:ribosomal protein L9